MAEYGKLKGSGPVAVPVENNGGPGTADSHWRETLFRNELMSGFIAASNNPLSRLTVCSLQDLGYVVDLNAAEPYTLPNLMALAEAGLLTAHVAPGVLLAAERRSRRCDGYGPGALGGFGGSVANFYGSLL